MTARREAKRRDVVAVVTTVGGVPRPLLVGRCIEVWADPEAPTPQFSAMRRFGAARTAWLDVAGLEDCDRWSVIPGGSPWSVAHLISEGHAEWLTERLARADATVEDIADLRAEAVALLESIPDRKALKWQRAGRK